MIVKLLIVGHIIGDFYAQTDKIAEEKKTKFYMLLKHCIIYVIMLAMFSIIPLAMEELIRFLIFIFVIGILHGIIDNLKVQIEKRKCLTPKQGIYLFVIDQIFHVSILVLGCRLMGLSSGDYVQILNENYYMKEFSSIVNMVIGILICGRPASILIKLVFSTITNTIDKENPKEKPKENPKVGSYIGILEREIIFFLGMMGQYGAIGFVLTAKSVARFKQLEDQTFAEKYLVGTLLSVVISIACIGMYNHFKA